MKALKAFYVAVAMMLCSPAFAQQAGYQPAPAVGSTSLFFVCTPDGATVNCATGAPMPQQTASMSQLVAGLLPLLPTQPASVQVLIVQGNAAGTYAVPAITATNKLLLGLSSREDLSTTPFNWSSVQFILASNQINATTGWQTGAGQLIDPTATNWTNFNLIWLYE